MLINRHDELTRGPPMRSPTVVRRPSRLPMRRRRRCGALGAAGFAPELQRFAPWLKPPLNHPRRLCTPLGQGTNQRRQTPARGPSGSRSVAATYAEIRGGSMMLIDCDGWFTLAPERSLAGRLRMSPISYRRDIPSLDLAVAP